MQAIALQCPGCGGRIDLEMKCCPYCGGPVIITSINSVSSLSPLDLNKYASAYRQALEKNPASSSLAASLAICYLQLRLYDKAAAAFERAVEDSFDNSETLFYAAISLFKGKKAFLATRAVIDKACEYLSAAIMIEPKGIYYYLLAYIKYDYFYRKGFKTEPDYRETLAVAVSQGLSKADVEQCYTLLSVQRPECL